MRLREIIAAAIWTGFAGWVGASACLATDVVVLRSGSMMEGEVVSMDAKELVLAIESGKSILDRADIRSIHLETTIAELRDQPATPPTPEPGAHPDEKPAPGEDHGPVLTPSDKKEFALGDAVRVGALQLRLASAAITKVKVVDLLGGVNESRDEFLVLRFEAKNAGSMNDLVISGDPVFGEALVRVENAKGKQVRGKSFGAGSRVQGALRDGDRIASGATSEDLEVFERPGEGAKELVVRVNLERFGESGTLVWRIAASEIK